MKREFVIDAMHEKVSNLLAGGFHVLFYQIEMQKGFDKIDTALVIIDVQNDYFPQGKCELFQSEQALKVTKRLLEHFRERKLPIFYVQHISPEGAAFFLPNTKGVQLHKEIEPLGSEYIIVKHTPNGFHETTLQEKLTSLSIKNLVMCGMMTHMCVDTTVRAAKDLGHLVTLISDACATKDLEWNGRKLPASLINDVYMASLNGRFATVMSSTDYLL